MGMADCHEGDRMVRSDSPDGPVRSRVRWTLLALLWVWVILVFVVIDLSLNVEEFDGIRPGLEFGGHASRA